MASVRRVVVLIDALDQFEATTRGQFTTWLPRLWPANARLIATAVPCEASKALVARAGVEPLALPPLDADEARRIAEAICARYHRTLEPEVVEALLAKRGEAGPAWGNTLWLVLAVEELNLVDGDDFGRAMRTYTGSIAEQLRALMLDIVADLPSDVLGLYAESFERAEKLFSSALAQAFLGFIAISRAGWRESDFRGLLPRATGENWDELQFASLRRLFRGQIRQRGAMGQWDVNHAQMRAAIRRYLRRRTITEAQLHAFAAQHLLLSLSADDPLRQSETMVHLLGSKDWQLVAEFYGSESLTRPELYGATRVLADVVLASRQAGGMTGLDQVLNLLRAVGQISDHRTAVITGNLAERLQFNLEPLLAERGELGSRAILLDANCKALERLGSSNPKNIKWQHNLLVSHNKIGDVLLDQGNLAEALTSYQAAHRICDRLAKADPSIAGWQHNLAVSHNKISKVLVAQGNLPAALASLRVAHDIADRLTKAHPGNASLQHELGVAQDRIGDVLVVQGNLPEALAAYKASHAVADRLAKAEPGNADWQCNLSLSQEKIGNVVFAQGHLPEALAVYRASHDIRDRLAKVDPGNAGWQRNLSVSQDKLGDVLVAQGNLLKAVAAYKGSLDISLRLAKTDPGNAGWQSDLAFSQERVGDVLLALGNLSEALAAYKAVHGIRDRLVRSDPANAGWQRDLSLSHNKIGDALVAQGDLAGALAAFQSAHDIAERLAKSDPANAGWQHDLSVAQDRIGDMLVARGNLSEALVAYRAAYGIRDRLVKSEPCDAGWQHDLSVSHNKVGNVLVTQGNLPEALAAYRAAHGIAERLTKAAPGNVGWQRALAVSHIKIGNVLTAEGNLAEALAAHRAAHDIFDRLTELDPHNAGWRRDLAVAQEKIGELLARQSESKQAHAQAAFHEGHTTNERPRAISSGNATLSKGMTGMTTPWVRDQISHASQAFQEQRDRTALKCLLDVLSVYPSEQSALRFAGRVLKVNQKTSYRAASKEPLTPGESQDPRLDSLFCRCDSPGCGAEWISANVADPDQEYTIANPIGGRCTHCGKYFCRDHFGAGAACPQCGHVLDYAPPPNGRPSSQTARLNKPLVHVLVMKEGTAPPVSVFQEIFQNVAPDVLEDSPTVCFCGDKWPAAPMDYAMALLARDYGQYISNEYDVRTAVLHHQGGTRLLILKVFANRPKIVDPTAPAQQTNIVDAPASAQKQNSGWLSKVGSLFATKKEAPKKAVKPVTKAKAEAKEPPASPPPSLTEAATVVRYLSPETDCGPASDGPSDWGKDDYGTWLEVTVDGVAQRLRWIREGRFLMGSPEDEPMRNDGRNLDNTHFNEGPRHEVQINKGFFLFDTPVTQALWQAVMGGNPSAFLDPKRPVESVSWDDAMAFILRFNALGIIELGLPTEAQWEYACRAGTDTATYAGPIEILGPLNAPILDAIAWYAGNNGEEFNRALSEGRHYATPQQRYEPNRMGTRPVGLKKPNAWGCYDMLGNVWEWCADDVRKYTADPVTDPVGSLDSARRTIRGGSWGGVARSVRAAMRSGAPRDHRGHGIGFRCVRVWT